MATSYEVSLLFKAPKTTALDQLTRQLGEMDRKAKAIGGADPFQGMENSAKGATGAVRGLDIASKGLLATFGPLLAAFSVLGSAKFIFDKTAEIEKQTKSLEVLTGSLTKTKDIIAELQAFGAVTPFTSSELIDTAKRLTAFGVSAERVVDVTKRLGDVSGATGAELSGIVTAYGQAVAKGVLQGEELLQFQERGVNVLDELRKMYGLTGEEMQDALSKGKVSSEALEVAIERLTEKGGKYADGAIAQSTTLSGKLSTLQDNVESLARKIGDTLMPVIKGVLDAAIQATNAISALLDQQNNQSRELDYGKRADAEISRRYNSPLDALTKGGEMYDQRQRMIEQYRADDAYERSLKQPKPAAAARSTVPALLGGTAGGGGGGRGGGGGTSYPAYIDKSVLRQWLMSQGMGRTSGDFTNSGHRTPNHMLNAMDMGFTSSKYDHNYVQKTIEMERRLRATGAFGSQLFGPERDPSGHKDHLHVPTPGGKVRVNAALAQLMGLGGKGGGTAMAMANWQNQSDQNAASEAEKEAARQRNLDSLKANVAYGKEALGIQERLNTAKAAEDKLGEALAQNQLDKLQYQKEYADIVRSTTDPEERKLKLQEKELELVQLNRDYVLEKAKIEKEAAQKINDLMVEKAKLAEGAIRPIQDEIDLMQAQIDGTEKILAAKREMAALTNAGVSPEAAQGLIGQRDALKARQQTPGFRLGQEITQRQKDLDALMDPANQLISAADSIGMAFADAFQGIATGSMTAGQALSNMFKSIGASFIQMATQMLAQQAALSILKLFGGALGGGAGGGIGAFGSSGILGLGAGALSFAGGGYTGDSARSGGVDGQGGFPAILHPQETVVDHRDTSSAMARYRPGSNIKDNRGTGSGAAAGGEESTARVQYEVTRVNNINYVDEETFRREMAESERRAATRGAEGGYAMVGRDLQNRRSVRSRWGVR
jgi:tape measure domain-containing protein